MNIGIVTQWFASGAGHVSKAYEEVLAKTHRVFIYARGGKVMKGHPTWDGPNVTWAPYHPCSTGLHPRHFKAWARRNRIDALLFNEQRHWHGVVLARELDLLCGAYVDYYTQDTVPFFGLYDFLICNTQRHYSVFREHPQCLYVPWGTQMDAHKPPPIRLDRPVTFLISAGWCGAHSKNVQWMDRRGVGMSMRAFRHVRGECRLIVLSQVPLSACSSDWQNSVETDTRIEFRVGTFDPVPYWDGDVYVYPSRLDGIGLTLPEALSAGLPAITTDSPPMSEFVHDGENGTLVKVRNFCARPDGYYWPESICDEHSLTAAYQFYQDDPNAVRRQSEVARELARRDLCWQKNAAALAEWISARQRLGGQMDRELSSFATRACRYDNIHNPMPFQRLLISGKAIGAYLIRRAFRE